MEAVAKEGPNEVTRMETRHTFKQSGMRALLVKDKATGKPLLKTHIKVRPCGIVSAESGQIYRGLGLGVGLPNGSLCEASDNLMFCTRTHDRFGNLSSTQAAQVVEVQL